jgi:hypothetical protein
MGEFRDMGIPAPVVKETSCTGFVLATSAGIPMSVNKAGPAHAGKIFIHESQHNKHFVVK